MVAEIKSAFIFLDYGLILVLATWGNAQIVLPEAGSKMNLVCGTQKFRSSSTYMIWRITVLKGSQNSSENTCIYDRNTYHARFSENLAKFFEAIFL